MGQPSELLNQLGAATPGSLITAIYFPEHQTKQFPAGDVVSGTTASLGRCFSRYQDGWQLTLWLSAAGTTADYCRDQCPQRCKQGVQPDSHCGFLEQPYGLQHVHPELHPPGACSTSSAEHLCHGPTAATAGNNLQLMCHQCRTQAAPPAVIDHKADVHRDATGRSGAMIYWRCYGGWAVQPSVLLQRGQ